MDSAGDNRAPGSLPPERGPADSAPAPPGRPPRSGGRRAGIVIIAVLAAVAIGLAVRYGPALVAGGAGTAAAAAPPPPPVTVSQPVHREIVEWDEFTGQFAPVAYVEIRARVSGYLQSIHFQDGQIVAAGDLLFVVDPRPFEATLAGAQAQLAQAQARLDLANRELARAGELRQREVASVSVYDQRVQEMRVAAAAVTAAEAAIRSAQLNVEFTRITAPIAGRISRHEVAVGNLVAADSTRLTTIVSLDPIQFNFDVSEADFLAYERAVAQGRLQSVRDGRVPVFAHLFDEQTWSLEGHIDFVDNQVDRTSGTIRARAVFPNPNGFVTPGQFGRVRIPGSDPYRAILIPDSAILTDQSRKIVMVVQDDGTVVPHIVRPGPMVDGLRVIRDGLAPTDRIVINGLMRARPGARVTPQPGEIVADPPAPR